MDTKRFRIRFIAGDGTRHTNIIRAESAEAATHSLCTEDTIISVVEIDRIGHVVKA